MGDQQRIYGVLRLRGRPYQLGGVGLQDGLWKTMDPTLRSPWSHYFYARLAQASRTPCRRLLTQLPHVNDGLLPVRLCCYHGYHYGTHILCLGRACSYVQGRIRA